LTSSYEKKENNFILASGSPRRRRLLQFLGIEFIVRPASIDENIGHQIQPEKVARKLAFRKAEAQAGDYKNAIILGADTIVVHKNKILEKPSDEADAEAMLNELSDSTHKVITGVSLLRTAENGITDKLIFVEVTRVTFGKLDTSLIQQYIAGGSPLDKAGAYGIQDPEGAIFVKRIQGDYYNVVGLPLHALHKRLKKFAPNLLIVGG